MKKSIWMVAFLVGLISTPQAEDDFAAALAEAAAIPGFHAIHEITGMVNTAAHHEHLGVDLDPELPAVTETPFATLTLSESMVPFALDEADVGIAPDAAALHVQLDVVPYVIGENFTQFRRLMNIRRITETAIGHIQPLLIGLEALYDVCLINFSEGLLPSITPDDARQPINFSLAVRRVPSITIEAGALGRLCYITPDYFAAPVGNLDNGPEVP